MSKLDLNKQFIRDVQVHGCCVLAGSYNYADAVLTPGNLEGYLDGKGDINTFFVSGVDPGAGLVRVHDPDIIKKSHIFFDFDLRKEHPELGLAELKGLAQYFADCLEGSPYGDWRYIVFTGGGLHVHYISEDFIVPTNNRLFAAGYKAYLREIEGLVGEKADPACCNLSRLVRLPGSWNVKQETIDAYGKQQVEIMLFQDKWFDLGEIESLGEAELAKQAEIAKAKAAERLENFNSTENSAFDAINALPIASLLAHQKQWETDGRNFWEPGKEYKHKACFVPPGENFVVHGGTHHLGNREGYSCFELIKELQGLDNRATFEWFKDNFPHINEISQAEFKEVLDKAEELKKLEEVKMTVPKGNIANVFERLSKFSFEMLSTGLPYADENKWLIRGAVTRIGAPSSVGKSTFAYWLCHNLLIKNYKGVIISTEVQAPLVLANMLKTKNKWDFWRILDHEYLVTSQDLEFYNNLWIYDSLQTENKMEKIRPMLAELKPDFVIVDFLQGVHPTEGNESNYQKLTNYAFEVQQMAQELECSVIDLSQISNVDIKMSKNCKTPTDRLNQLNFKGSGDLFSSADVCLFLDRNKEADEDEVYGPNYFGVRMAKHKYMATNYTFLDVDFATGRFVVAEPIEEEVDYDDV